MGLDDYTSTPSTGKLKLKGVADGRIDKKKKKKKHPKPEGDDAQPESAVPNSTSDDFIDRSVVLKSLEDEDKQITKSSSEDAPEVRPSDKDVEDDDPRSQVLTASQRRFEEQRRKRLEERLKREGVKTHKQRVEELNKYLSGLSEHHDMPKIGPG